MKAGQSLPKKSAKSIKKTNALVKNTKHKQDIDKPGQKKTPSEDLNTEQNINHDELNDDSGIVNNYCANFDKFEIRGNQIIGGMCPKKTPVVIERTTQQLTKDTFSNGHDVFIRCGFKRKWFALTMFGVVNVRNRYLTESTKLSQILISVTKQVKIDSAKLNSQAVSYSKDYPLLVEGKSSTYTTTLCWSGDPGDSAVGVKFDAEDLSGFLKFLATCVSGDTRTVDRNATQSSENVNFASITENETMGTVITKILVDLLVPIHEKLDFITERISQSEMKTANDCDIVRRKLDYLQTSCIKNKNSLD